MEALLSKMPEETAEWLAAAVKTYVIGPAVLTSADLLEMRAIIKETDENGTIHERILTEAEMKELADQEYKKMEEGKSELNEEPKSEGMGLAGTILAAAGGALLGNMIGNALMNNKNVQRHNDMSNRSAYHQSKSGTGASSGSAKKSFFGNSASKSTGSSSSYGG